MTSALFRGATGLVLVQVIRLEVAVFALLWMELIINGILKLKE